MPLPPRDNPDRPIQIAALTLRILAAIPVALIALPFSLTFINSGGRFDAVIAWIAGIILGAIPAATLYILALYVARRSRAALFTAMATLAIGPNLLQHFAWRFYYSQTFANYALLSFAFLLIFGFILVLLARAFAALKLQQLQNPGGFPVTTLSPGPTALHVLPVEPLHETVQTSLPPLHSTAAILLALGLYNTANTLTALVGFVITRTYILRSSFRFPNLAFTAFSFAASLTFAILYIVLSILLLQGRPSTRTRTLLTLYANILYSLAASAYFLFQRWNYSKLSSADLLLPLLPAALVTAVLLYLILSLHRLNQTS